MGRGGQELRGSGQTESRTHVLFVFTLRENRRKVRTEQTPLMPGPRARGAGVHAAHSCLGPGLPLAGRRPVPTAL